jgi:hypothetical protein
LLLHLGQQRVCWDSSFSGHPWRELGFYGT